METSFEDNLLKVNVLDIYDDIVDLKISSGQLKRLCLLLECRVNVHWGNVVYAVEKKYKHKIENYNDSKRIKWLNVNLKAIMPNPEEKIIKWQKKQSKKKKIDWLRRKLDALDYFSDELAVYNMEEHPCSRTLRMIPDRRLSSISQASNNCFNRGSTTASSVQTVIASQPRNTDETAQLENFAWDIFKDIPHSSSEDININSENGAVLHENNNTSRPDTTNQSTEDIYVARQPPLMPLIQESEDFLTHVDLYATFYQDMHITSTQEIG